MSLEIKDLAGLSEPITKLIDVVSSAIGSTFRPNSMKSEADAKAYEIKALAKANAEAAVIIKEIERSAMLSTVDTLAASHPELAERAKHRLLLREIEGQLNVEAIANHAALELPSSVSNEPVNPDWRRKFFAEAENVCEQDMQLLWGKVLAGEISSPGAFSLRTLDALRHISKHEAELFRRACSLAMNAGWIAIPGGDLNKDLQPFGFTYNDILTLRDAGLFMDGDNIHKDFSVSQPIAEPEKHEFVLFNNGVLIQMSGPGSLHLRISTLLFTQVGRELQRLIEPAPCEEYLRALGAHLRSRSVVVKRGTSTPQSEGVSVITFEEDL
jgi:hypothetical protein